MSDLKIAVGGNDYITEQTTTQIAIAQGTNNFTIAFAAAGTAVNTNVNAYVATVTFASAHGLTFSPAAGTLPNYFIKFASTSGISGTGVLNGNVFRILSIPSTTTLTFYTTVSAATTTGASVIPVFYPVMQQALLSGAATGVVTGSNNSFAVAGGYPYYGTVQCANITTGSNTTIYYNPDNLGFPLDQSTGLTPSTAPTVRSLISSATAGQFRFGPLDYIAQTGTNASQTTYVSIVE
jgi:hypothetical protein